MTVSGVLLQLVVPPARVSDLKCTQMRMEMSLPSDPLRRGNRREGREEVQVPTQTKPSGVDLKNKVFKIIPWHRHHTEGPLLTQLTPTDDADVVTECPHQELDKMKLV